MKNFKKNVPVTRSTVFFCLKKDLLTAEEAVAIIFENNDKLNYAEGALIEMGIHSNHKSSILSILDKEGGVNEDNGYSVWRLSQLVAIEKSGLTISQKLKAIEREWANLNYPQEWRKFIYYMPNESANSEEGLYEIFLEYLSTEKAALSWIE
jgi:hypothetical protein